MELRYFHVQPFATAAGRILFYRVLDSKIMPGRSTRKIVGYRTERGAIEAGRRRGFIYRKGPHPLPVLSPGEITEYWAAKRQGRLAAEARISEEDDQEDRP